MTKYIITIITQRQVELEAKDPEDAEERIKVNAEAGVTISLRTTYSVRAPRPQMAARVNPSSKD